MPIARKLIKIGGARYISIPMAWLDYYEKKYGKPIEELLMELNNEITLVVEPPLKHEG